MKAAIRRVEERGEELEDDLESAQTSPSSSHLYALEDAAGASKDRQSHKTFEVGFGPICQIDVPELVSSDASTCSGAPDQQMMSMTTDVSSSVSAPPSAPPSNVQPIQDPANKEIQAYPAASTGSS